MAVTAREALGVLGLRMGVSMGEPDPDEFLSIVRSPHTRSKQSRQEVSPVYLRVPNPDDF